MKNYFRLNLTFNPLNNKFQFPQVTNFNDGPLNRWQIFLPQAEELLSSECLDFIRSLDLEPDKCHLFGGGPGYTAPIHIDGYGTGQGPLWAINWIYGAEKSQMRWYKPLQEGISNFTPANTPQVLFTEDELELVDSYQFDKDNQGPILVRTDVPHTAINQDLNNARWCLSVRVKRTRINDWFSAVKTFKQYLIQ